MILEKCGSQEKGLGKEFWNRVYRKVQEQHGNVQIPVNTFNKVWIMADKAEVFEQGQTAFVVTCHLKVMLEEDYLAQNRGQRPIFQNDNPNFKNRALSPILRDLILPELEHEVNTGKNFANLRQICNSIILASWYKKNLKQALLNQVYSNQAKIKGIDLEDKDVKAKIYTQYLQAYKKGVFNYIKDTDTPNGVSGPIKYFSGGFVSSAMMSNPVKVKSLRTIVDVKQWIRLGRFVMINAYLKAGEVGYSKKQYYFPRGLPLWARRYSSEDLIEGIDLILERTLREVKKNVKKEGKTVKEQIGWSIYYVGRDAIFRGFQGDFKIFEDLLKTMVHQFGVERGWESEFSNDLYFVQFPKLRNEDDKRTLDDLRKDIIKWLEDLKATASETVADAATVANESLKPGKWWHLINDSNSRVRITAATPMIVMFNLNGEMVQWPLEMFLKLYEFEGNRTPPKKEKSENEALKILRQEVQKILETENINLSTKNITKSIQRNLLRGDAFINEESINSILRVLPRKYRDHLLDLYFDAWLTDKGREDTNQFGRYLIKLRIKRGISVQKMAEEYAGLATVHPIQKFISTAEQGNVPVDLRKLASIYDVSVEELRKQIDSAEIATNAPGGIDVDPSKADISVKKQGAGVEMNVDPAILEEIKKNGIESLSPHIYQITPIENLQAVLDH